MKLHLACANDDLRPAMSYIQLKNCFLYATNAHIAVKVDFNECGLNSVFTDQDEIYIHKDAWRNFIPKLHMFPIEKTGNLLTSKDKKGNSLFCEFMELTDFTQKIGRYPDVECVINYCLDDLITPVVNTLGLDFKLANTLQDALGLEKVALKFFGESKQIQIFDPAGEKNVLGILMPAIVNADIFQYPKIKKEKKAA
jgi:hypothetical protein